MADLTKFQNRLGYTFRDIALLRMAVTHPSVAHEQGTAVQHNQRLEFLGDAVLQLILTLELYAKFPSFGEGPLTKARAQLVNRRTLEDQARNISLGEYLVLSRGEEISGGRERQSALADAFEAVIGAIYLDGGLAAATQFILRVFTEVFGELKVIPNLDNPKGELQEILQVQSPEPPQYALETISGPDHNRVFECSVRYQGRELGRGCGKSKKEAEGQAALNALARIRKETV